jgi:hypothetical protein
MAGIEHEAIVELLRNRPQLALELLESVVPGCATSGCPDDLEARIESVDFGDAKPLERAADFVASFGSAANAVRVIVEVQRSPDLEKRLSWPGYVAVSWARNAQRTYLLVITLDVATARWAAEPIDVGHFEFRPIVVGPNAVPVITETDAARRSPELAVLSLGVHRDHPEVLAIADAALAAVQELDEARARFYSELVGHWLPAATRAILEANMDIKREFISEFSRRNRAEGRAEGEAEGRAEGEAKGRAEGRAEAVLRVLGARGLSVSDAVAARVRGCTDVAVLDAWIERAVRVETAEKLFD